MPAGQGTLPGENMRDSYFRRGFFQHRGLIAVAAGGAIAETLLLTFLAPGARPLAPQATALPSIAAYHDVRWLFAGQQSDLVFGVAAVVLLFTRAGIDAALLRLAWPRPARPASGTPPPPAPSLPLAIASCATLTALAWLLLAPAVTLTFGAAVVPFSWPFLAALPLVVLITSVLGHGGLAHSWWRRLPPPAAVLWVLVSFGVLSLASAAMLHLAAIAAVGVAAVAGILNARAWYGVAGAVARLPHEVAEHPSLWRLPGRLLWWVPVAPIAAVLVVALAVGLVRLVFTGTIQIPAPGSVDAAAISAASRHAQQTVTSHVMGAVLVVAGFGSTCCDDTGDLRQADPDLTVQQFSYAGMDAAGRPLPQGGSADDVPLPLLGDRMAAQLLRLHDRTGLPVDIVAESEGTLGVYAMLDRHPGLPIGSIVMLSPILAPGQYGADGSQAIPQDALAELNGLIGSISPYGSSGAENLIRSVADDGAEYFSEVARHRNIRWMAVVPLADATTLPDCALPSNVLVVPEFHGGLLGDPGVQSTVRRFLAGLGIERSVETASQRLHTAVEAIAGVTEAWRMPVTRPLCP